MYILDNSHRLFFSCVIIVFIYSQTIFSQQHDKKSDGGIPKAKIIFNNQIPDSVEEIIPSDTAKSKIVFKKSHFLRKDELKLLSVDKYEFQGVGHSVGDNGELLIEAMGKNQRSIGLVKDAKKSRESGKTLMILAGVAFVVTLATIPYVELGKTESDGYVTTYYWIPPITIGVILGGIGYSKYNSYEKKLREAITAYNEDLIKTD